MLNVNQQEINLGNLKFGVPYKFNYVVTNKGHNKLIIKKILRGCASCTEAEVKQSLLVPNEQTTILVTFTPGSTGIQYKNITVVYDIEGEDSHELSLSFKGKVDG